MYTSLLRSGFLVGWWMFQPFGSAYAGGGGVCRLRSVGLSWQEAVRASADRTTLPSRFRAQGYRPPRRSFLLASRVVPGLGQPAFAYLSLGKTGFVSSAGRYWPASTVKLWAAVGALMRLHLRHLDATTLLFLADGAGLFHGTVAELMLPLANIDYDRLLRIASAKLLNQRFRKRFGYRHLSLLRGYGGTGRVSVSPRIPFLHAGRAGVLSAMGPPTQSLPCRKNCVSLSALQDILRRLVFHRALPRTARFPIVDADVQMLLGGLKKQWKWVKPAIHQVLGRDAVIFNKAGSVPGYHLLDNAAIFSKHGRYLLTLASPWPRRQPGVGPSLRVLNELARQSLLVLRRWRHGTPLQQDAGTKMTLSLLTKRHHKRRGRRRFRMEIKGPGLVAVELWHGPQRVRIKRNQGGGFEAELGRLRPGLHVFVARGYGPHKLRSHRMRAFRIPSTRRHLHCR